jgi:xylitol oxidase
MNSSQRGLLANWAGNVQFQATGLLRPDSVSELQQLVAGSGRIRALGSGHSFSPVADTSGVLVSTAGLPPRAELGEGTVTVSSGLRYAEVATRLHAAGRALRNLGSLPHITVAGAVATGTHGSGDRNGSLAAAVSAIELVTASGELLTATRTEDSFDGLVVALGACGIVTALTLDTVPAFEVRQYVYENLAFEDAARQFADIMGAGYSVSLFADFAAPRFGQIRLKLVPGQRRPPADWLGTKLASRDLSIIAGQPAASTTTQRGIPGPWHVPSSGGELQSEFLVGREHAPQALAALAGLSAELAPVTQIAEVRTVAADQLWLSMSYQRDSAAFHFTWIPDPGAVLPVVALVQAALNRLDARPHWGKIFTTSPLTVAERYPRLADFRRLAADLDPGGKFGNSMLAHYLGLAAA